MQKGGEGYTAGRMTPVFLALYAVSVGIALCLFALSYSLDPGSLMTISIAVLLVASGWIMAGLISARSKSNPLTTGEQTDQVHLEAERERILTLINNIADAVISTDKDGKITLYNAAVLGILDTNASLEGAHLDEVFSVHDSDNVKVQLFTAVRESRSATVNDTLRMSQPDQEMRLEFTYSPIRGSYSGDQTTDDGYIIIVRDVTRIKSLEEERDEFISVVSHELRTPITVAEGSISNAQLLVARGKNDPKVIASTLHEAHEQTLYLARMINDLSTLSRAERGVASETEVIDVSEMAHAIFTEYDPEAKKAGLHLNLNLGPKLGAVNVSRLYLHELLQNFVTNAIKYTHEGSVTINIKATTSTVHFSVTDTGIGINKADQQKVFDKFFRSEDYRTRETGGTGLGLYVAAKLAHKLGTSITLTSRLNHGSTFGFDLPKYVEARKSKSIRDTPTH